MDIDIHKITQEYLTAIQNSRKLNLNEGGEFIRMAAWLMLIKSRSLLPESLIEEEETAEEEHLSKEDLIKALTQRRQLLSAVDKLHQRPLLNRDIWSCSGLSFQNDSAESIEEGEIFSLTEAFRNVLKKAHKYSMTVLMPSLFEWMGCIRKYFVKGKTLLFSELVREKKNQPQLNRILLSFLSLLELGRQGFVSLSQEEGGDIAIQTKKDIDENIFKMDSSTESVV